MATNPGSAKNGTCTFKGVELNVTDISITRVEDQDVYASSKTGGQKSRIGGHSDTTGSWTQIEPPAFAEGAEGQLTINSDIGEVAYNGLARVESIEDGYPVEGGTRKTYTVTFGQLVNVDSSELDSGDSSL